MNIPTCILLKTASIAHEVTGRAANLAAAVMNQHAESRLKAINMSVYHFLRYLGVSLLLIGLTLGSTVAVSADAQPVVAAAQTTVSPVATDDTTTSASDITEGPTTSTVSDQSISGVPAGVAEPTGADAGTYQYDAASGLWENEYYTWNPQTGQTTAKVAPVYTYNQQTGLWDTSISEYQVASNDYVLTPVSVSSPPAGAVTSGGPADVVTGSNEDLNTSAGSISSANSNPADSNTSTVGISNTINSIAQSGDATVEDNAQGGNATSGTATAEATVLNELQSSSALTATGLSTLTQDISGDSQGNLIIDPSQLAAAATEAATSPAPLIVHNQLDGTIDTNISLAATSGNAMGANNQTAGNATSGEVTTDANVLNLDDSVISAAQSFLGIININGSYSGNIEVPTFSTASLEAANDLLNMPTSLTTAVPPNTVSSDQAITTTVDLAAASGMATEQDNGLSGVASSGVAQTKLTVLNIANQQVSGVDGLLVFVNVLGSWTGSIMNAPTDTTAAALVTDPIGSGVTMPMSAVSSTPLVNNMAIQTTINERAQSGEATVEQNGQAGTAISGAATASANVVNIVSSQYSLSDWFGVLFINVFGNWTGNLGAEQLSSSITAVPATASPLPSPVNTAPIVASSLTPPYSPADGSLSTNAVPSAAGADRAVTGHANVTAAQSRPRAVVASSHTRVVLPVAPIVLVLLALILISVERLSTVRRI